MSHRNLDKIKGGDGSGDLASSLAKEGLARTPKKKQPTASVADDPDGAVFVDEVEDFLEQRRRAVFSSRTKTTLIVAPLAVVEQWQREATEKTGHALHVYVHHGPGRAKTVDVLRKADVVITTYATAANEHAQYLSETGDGGSKENPIVLDSSESSSDAESSDSDTPIAKRGLGGKAQKQTSRSPLFQMKWLRVVLGTCRLRCSHRRGPKYQELPGEKQPGVL